MSLERKSVLNSEPALSSSGVAEVETPLWQRLGSICLVVFMEFLAMGLPLSVLPAHVHETLGLGPVFIGIVIGAQSWATLLTRHLAGTRSDLRGPRFAVLVGLCVSATAGVLYAISSLTSNASSALALLLLGRGVLGLGESLVITGALAWGVAMAGRERTGLVMAWVGIAMYGAMAVGAPLGGAIDARFGFVGMAAAAALAPLVGIAAAFTVRPVSPTGGMRLPFYRVLGSIAVPGAGLSLSAVGFGAIAAFSTLAFKEHGWRHAALAMTSFGAAYVLARLVFGRLPDRFGGARVAAASAAVAGVGQLGMWFASTGTMAVAAAALTGFGFSLAFPSFGVEAMKRVPPQSRGVALGAYAACFDATMGIGVPLLGVVVARYGSSASFAVGTVAAFASLFIALRLATRTPSGAV